MAKVRTIQDMEALYYSPEFSEYVAKADAPVLSTTTGVYNAVYGAQVWAQFNQEANVFAVIPKVPWQRSGWRVLTARAGSSADGGAAENATIPDTTKPTFLEVSVKPATVVHTFDVSEVQDFLARNGDDAVGDLDWLRGHFAVKHREAINQQLLADANTTISSGFESIDRVVGSQSEESGCVDAGDLDIYGIDRSAVTWADAYVDHNSGTDRVLTDKMIRELVSNARDNGGNPTVWITGWDTYARIQGLYDSQVRYSPLGQSQTKIGVNGVETMDGIGVGINVTTLYGIPLIVSKDTVKDTISRIYLLDTSDPEGYGVPRLRIEVAKPTQYFEAKDFFSIDRMGYEGMFRTMGQLKCSYFTGQAKIRDLK